MRASRLVWVLAVVMTAGVALADGYRNPPEGAAALGRGGARTVYADDASVVTHNPAAMTDLKGGAVTPSVTFGFSQVDYTSAYGGSESAEAGRSVLPAVYGILPLGDGSSVAGVAIHSPYGQSMEWAADGLFRGLAPYYAEMVTVEVSPSFAVDLGGGLSLGAGLNILRADLEFHQQFPWAPPPAGLAGPFSRLRFEADGYGVGGTVGLVWRLGERQRLALTYRSEISTDLNGTFTMDTPPPAAAMPPGFNPASSFDTEVHFAPVATLGYGLRVTDALRVQAEVEWIQHSVNETMPLDIGANNALLLAALGTTDVPQQWEDTWTAAVGADYALDGGWTLRAGYTWLPSPVPDATTMPVLVEGDKHIIGIGLGRRFGRQAVDVAYACGLTADRKIEPAENPAVAGVYETESHLASLTYTLAF